MDTKEPDCEVARPELPDNWLPKSAPALTGELDRSRKPLAQQLSPWGASIPRIKEYESVYGRATAAFLVLLP
jgi:hypothetical protein